MNVLDVFGFDNGSIIRIMRFVKNVLDVFSDLENSVFVVW